MAKIKYTKQELKRQRDALQRYERYLPTLQLKKQHLQAETRVLEERIRANDARVSELERGLSGWVRLFSEDVDLGAHLRVGQIRHHTGSIAGVSIPELDDVTFERSVPDLFATPPWMDDGLEVVGDLIRLRIERLFLERQRTLLREELRTTSQRVNLFEKVKIPEARENIRVIRIVLGDLQAAGVARAKIAKQKTGHLLEMA